MTRLSTSLSSLVLVVMRTRTLGMTNYPSPPLIWLCVYLLQSFRIHESSFSSHFTYTPTDEVHTFRNDFSVVTPKCVTLGKSRVNPQQSRQFPRVRGTSSRGVRGLTQGTKYLVFHVFCMEFCIGKQLTDNDNLTQNKYRQRSKTKGH